MITSLKKALFSLSLIITIVAGKAQKIFFVTNGLQIKRKDALVILTRKEIEKKTGKLIDPFLYLSDAKHRNLTVQQDDLDGDGKWDEAVFLYSFEPGQTAVFHISTGKRNLSSGVPPRAHVRLKQKTVANHYGPNLLKDTMPFNNPPTDFSKYPLPQYLTEGPAWENDKVAFRQYFDLRNERDIYGKRIAGMVMDTVGANPKNSYHQLSGWGMDILHVAKSLGAGSIAIAVHDRDDKDTLIRLGGKNISRQIFEQVADGPVRAIMKMSYQWQINDQPVSIVELTSIWGGQYFYETSVLVNGLPANAKLITGIADFYENKADSFTTANCAVLLSYGKQSENKDELGMAVMVPKKYFSYCKEAPVLNADVLQTHLIAQQVINDSPVIYRFYSCWEKSDAAFGTGTYFKQYLQQQAAEFGNALKVEW